MPVGGLVEQSLDVRGGLRPPEVVALSVSAAEPAQAGQLIGGFDAFGDGVEAEMSAEAEDGAGDRGVVWVLVSPLMKDWSILRNRTGKSLMRLSEE